jgi:hypothetical protein
MRVIDSQQHVSTTSPCLADVMDAQSGRTIRTHNQDAQSHTHHQAEEVAAYLHSDIVKVKQADVIQQLHFLRPREPLKQLRVSLQASMHVSECACVFVQKKV